MIFIFSLTISFVFDIRYLLGCMYCWSYYTLCVFMVSIQRFSRQYPANTMNIVWFLTYGLCYTRCLPCLTVVHPPNWILEGCASYQDGVISSDVTVHIHNVFCWAHCAQQLNRAKRRHYEYRACNQDRTYEHPTNISSVCRNKSNNEINDQNTASNKYYSTRLYTLT